VNGLAHSAATALDTALDRTVVPGFSRVGHAVRRRLPTWPDDPASGALAGRHVIVTGASSGLGRRTALDLAGLGATVHLVVRDAGRGGRVAAEVETAVGRVGAARVWVCDVSDLDAVRAFCAAFLAAGLPLRALVHNAGALPPERTTSAQGHESTMALHVLGPVLMTELLLPALGADAGRVVFVTSGGMYTQALPVLDPDFEQGDWSGTVAYARSKRAQVELLPVLDRRWGTASGVSVHATHPGWASTPGVDTSLPRFAATMRPLLRPDGAGTDTTTWLVATEPAPASGLLWHDRRVRPTSVLPRTRSTAEDRELFWQWVAMATGLPA
jgi:NAD(P)-dependent dehydrogenase (short-subunit alcohol dehydrogenase family)